MPRPIWKGSISFGLVQVPVGLYSAENADELHFHLLDARDLQPVHYLRVNAKTREEVPWDRIVKGYEHAKGSYVTVTREDFERANAKATQTIELVAFVDAPTVSPLHFERPYYLAPDKRGQKPYALLREALRRTGKVGIATVVIRTRQHPAALLVVDDCLVLEILRFGHELRTPAELDLPALPSDDAVGKRELDMAEKLVMGMAGDFDPASIRDTYRDELVALLKRKAKAGGKLPPAPRAKKEPAAKVVDLMDLLRESLANRTRGPAKKAPRRARPRAA